MDYKYNQLSLSADSKSRHLKNLWLKILHMQKFLYWSLNYRIITTVDIKLMLVIVSNLK